MARVTAKITDTATPHSIHASSLLMTSTYSAKVIPLPAGPVFGSSVLQHVVLGLLDVSGLTTIPAPEQKNDPAQDDRERPQQPGHYAP